MAQKLPEGIPRLEAHLILLSGPIQTLQGALQKAEDAANAPQKDGRAPYCDSHRL